MGEENKNRIYVSMMLDSLQKKKSILNIIEDITKKQEKMLVSDELDTDAFEAVLEDKGDRIAQLEQIDKGFDMLFSRVEEEIKANRGDYEEEILSMKNVLSDIADVSAKIQVMEKKNSTRFGKYMSEQKSRVKKANLNQRTTSTYSQNMTGLGTMTKSYYFNETK